MEDPKNNRCERRILIWGLLPVLLGTVAQLPWMFVRTIWNVKPGDPLFDMPPVWIGICFPVGLTAFGACKAILLIARSSVRTIAKLPKMIREGTFKPECVKTLRDLATLATVMLEILARLLQLLLILCVVIVAATIAIWAFISFPVHVGVIVLILILLGR